MNKNVGGADRKWRWTFGSVLLIAGAVMKGWRRKAAWGLGLAALKTAWTQKCRINQALGINTYRSDEPKLASTQKPVVDETSEESMIASDAPSWVAGRS